MNRLTDWGATGLVVAAGLFCCGQAKATEVSTPNHLTLGGGLVTEYQYKGYAYAQQAPGGNFKLDYFEVNVKGRHGPLSYAAEERFSGVNFNSPYQLLHYGWAAYHFGAAGDEQIKVGYFKVPFGTLPYGYQSFWGNLGYYMGLTDNQAAGIGYKYTPGNWRFDADFFKNNTLGQTTTYGINPVGDYHSVNTGNVRVGYTFHEGAAHRITFAWSGKAGQLELGPTPNNQHTGKQWATAASINGHWGPWMLQMQATAYAYHVPGSSPYQRHSITVESYGYQYQIPAKGQLYDISLGKNFGISWGPFHKLQVYDDYGYLKVATPSRRFLDASGNTVGDIQLNETGVEAVAGPVYLWAELIAGKNAAGPGFTGYDNGNWYSRINVAMAYYFSTAND